MQQSRSEEHMALPDLLSYLESVCELLSLNKMKFVKLTQHPNFCREEKLSTKQKSSCKI